MHFITTTTKEIICYMEREDMCMCTYSVFSFLNKKEILGTISKFTTIVTIFTKGRIISQFSCFSEERKTQILVIFNTFQYYIISWNKATIFLFFLFCSLFFFNGDGDEILETWKMTKRIERFAFPASLVSSVTVCETLAYIWNRMKFYFYEKRHSYAQILSVVEGTPCMIYDSRST